MNLRTLTPILLLAALATAPLVGTAAADTTKTAEVTLRVAPEGFVAPSHYLVGNEAVWVIDPVEQRQFNDQDGVAGCVIDVTDDGDGQIDGTEVLDRATETGCIVGWDSVTHPSLGELVTEVDGREKLGPTDSGWPGAWWVIQLNGEAASTGVSGMSLTDGDALSFVYYVGA